MGKVQKKEWIAACGFGGVMGTANLFSRRILEIDVYSEELLRPEMSDFRWFVIGMLAGVACYLAFYYINARWDFRKGMALASGKTCFWITFALTMSSWSLQLLADNPCFLMGDTNYILEYGIGMAVQHPLLYVLFMDGGFQFFAGLTGSVSWGLLLMAWVQILLCSLVVSFVIFWLAEKGFNRVVTGCLILYYTFLPLIGHYNMSLVKDTWFGYFLLAATIAFYETAVTEKWLHKPGNFLLLVISFAGTMAIRNNGFYIILVLLIIALFLVDWKSRMFLTVTIAGVLFLNHFLSSGNLAQEKLGIPIQQAAYVLVKGEDVSPEDAEVLENIFPIERWRECYSPAAVDAIKWSDDFNRYWLNDNEKLFMKTWRHMARGHIKEYATAWLYQTYGLWNTMIMVSEGPWASQSIFSHDFDYVYTIRKTWKQEAAGYIPILPEVLAKLIRGSSRHIKYPGAGQCLWLTVMCGLAAVSLKDKRGILILLPVLGVTGTLFLSTPLSTAFRYSFCYVLNLPVMVCVIK